MTYKQLRDDTLRLLNQYSVAGEEVSPTYNNQADYLKRLPSLLNDGQMLIATTVRPITEMMELKPYAASRMGNWLRFILPEDFYRPSGRGLAVVQGSECFRSHEFQLLGSAALLPERCRSAKAAKRMTSNKSRLPHSMAPPVPSATFMPSLTQSRMGVEGWPFFAAVRGRATAEACRFPRSFRS